MCYFVNANPYHSTEWYWFEKPEVTSKLLCSEWITSVDRVQGLDFWVQSDVVTFLPNVTERFGGWYSGTTVLIV